jgi:two-component system, OmpR family, response regulator QseB
MRLLLVEDDFMLASATKLALGQAGYAVDWVGSAERAQEALSKESFDAAVVDVGLPGLDGLGLTRWIRAQKISVPVLILTARDSLQDRVQGLDCGADDYVLKPVELPELLARLRALLRRSQAATSSVIQFGALRFDTALRQAYADGKPLEFGPREWSVLEYMLLQLPKPTSKEKLLMALTGWDKEITANAVEVYASRLRSKLEPLGIHLRAVRGFGYRLEEHPVSSAFPAPAASIDPPTAP